MQRRWRAAVDNDDARGSATGALLYCVRVSACFLSLTPQAVNVLFYDQPLAPRPSLPPPPMFSPSVGGVNF